MTKWCSSRFFHSTLEKGLILTDEWNNETTTTAPTTHIDRQEESLYKFLDVRTKVRSFRFCLMVCALSFLPLHFLCVLPFVFYCCWLSCCCFSQFSAVVAIVVARCKRQGRGWLNWTKPRCRCRYHKTKVHSFILWKYSKLVGSMVFSHSST